MLTAIPVLAGISLILFTLLALAPGDPFGELATNPNVPPEVRMNLRKQFGLDDPIMVRYARWFGSMLQGEWGFSFVSRVDVDKLILQRLPTTLFVLGSAQLLALAVALPVGILSARRPYSLFDQVATTLAFIGFSLPTFFTGLLFILLFSIYLDWLPFIYRADIQETGPPLGLGEPQAGHHAHRGPRALPGRAADALRPLVGAGRDPARLHPDRALQGPRRADHHGQARGPERADPVVTLLAIQVPQIFTGALVTEQIFRVPGIGSLLISAILSNDTPVIMAITFVFSVLVVAFALIADLLYGWLDPRISFR